MNKLLEIIARFVYRMKMRNLDWPCECQGWVGDKKNFCYYMDLVQCGNCLGFMDGYKYMQVRKGLK